MARSQGTRILDATLDPAGYQQLTVAASSGFASVPTNACLAMIMCESQDVRWRDDGVDPTAAVGMVLPVGSVLLYTGDMQAIRFIETAATAKVNVSFYK